MKSARSEGLGFQVPAGAEPGARALRPGRRSGDREQDGEPSRFGIPHGSVGGAEVIGAAPGIRGIRRRRRAGHSRPENVEPDDSRPGVHGAIEPGRALRRRPAIRRGSRRPRSQSRGRAWRTLQPEARTRPRRSSRRSPARTNLPRRISEREASGGPGRRTAAAHDDYRKSTSERERENHGEHPAHARPGITGGSKIARRGGSGSRRGCRGGGRLAVGTLLVELANGARRDYP